MPKLPRKKTRVLAEQAELGRLNAQLKFHRKKPVLESIKEHIGKAIDRIDPLETAAVLATTFAVHETIVATKPLMDKIAGLTAVPANIFTFIMEIPSEKGLMRLITKTVKPFMTQDTLDWGLWIWSFVIAYILVKHGGSIIGLLDKSLPTIIGSFFGA